VLLRQSRALLPSDPTLKARGLLQQPAPRKGKYTRDTTLYPQSNPQTLSACARTCRLRGVIEALSSALDLTQPQALFMLASDLNLLDTPPLRVRQYVEALSQLLQVRCAHTEVPLVLPGVLLLTGW